MVESRPVGINRRVATENEGELANFGFQSSSMVEQPAVNRRVRGSSPLSGAIFYRKRMFWVSVLHIPGERSISVTRTSRAIGLFIPALLLSLLFGCSRSSPTPKSNELFVTWLQEHGTSNVVVDTDGVGIVGNPTRLRSSLYGSEQHTNGSFTAELEFRVLMPDRREIIEFVAGRGDTLKQAEDDAKVNFILSTFHVVYRSFLNPNDPHQSEQKSTINGQPRILVLGDTLTRSQTTNSSPDMFPFRDRFREILASQPLSSQTHWIKIIYANYHSNVMQCTVTLDNEGSPTLTDAVKNLPWPKQDEFYMVKQFVVVK